MRRRTGTTTLTRAAPHRIGSDAPAPAALGSITAGPVASAAPAATAAAGASGGAGSGPKIWLMAVALTWLLLAGLLASALGRSWWRLRRLLAGRRAIDAGPASTMLARLMASSGLRRRVRLSATPRVDVPIAVGILRPEIVLPERALVCLEPAALETMLAHELAHLLRRDPAWRLLTGLFGRLLFVQPLNRLAAARLELASEMLCDDWAVERTDKPLALARCLTEVASWVATPLGASVPAMARHGSGLGRRVRRLVVAEHSPGRRRPERWLLPLGAGVLVLVVFAAPGVGDPAGNASEPVAARVVSAAVPALPGALRGSSSASAAPAVPAAPAAPFAVPVPPAPPAPPGAPVLAGDPRRLLAQLATGHAGKQDLADWVALAQMLASPRQAADLSRLSRQLAQGVDLDVDVDVTSDPQGGIDIHINGLDAPGDGDGDDDASAGMFDGWDGHSNDNDNDNDRRQRQRRRRRRRRRRSRRRLRRRRRRSRSRVVVRRACRAGRQRGHPGHPHPGHPHP